jgi:hypothetical protein
VSSLSIYGAKQLEHVSSCYSEHYARVVQLEFSRTVGYTEYSCLYTDVNIAASRNSFYMLCALLQHVSAVA